jgi:hypothetical protein
MALKGERLSFRGRWQGYAAALLISAIIVALLNARTPASVWLWNHLHEESNALATWIAALATIALVYGVVVTRQALKESAQSAAFQRSYEHFNGPTLLHARAAMARAHLERVEKGGIERIRDNYVPDLGWQVVNFLNSVGHLVAAERIRFEDALFAYGQHVQVICARWQYILTLECQEDRFKPLIDLCARIDASPQRVVRNDIERTWEPAQEAFWKCEAALDPNAKSENESTWLKAKAKPVE